MCVLSKNAPFFIMPISKARYNSKTTSRPHRASRPSKRSVLRKARVMSLRKVKQETVKNTEKLKNIFRRYLKKEYKSAAAAADVLENTGITVPLLTMDHNAITSMYSDDLGKHRVQLDSIQVKGILHEPSGEAISGAVKIMVIQKRDVHDISGAGPGVSDIFENCAAGLHPHFLRRRRDRTATDNTLADQKARFRVLAERDYNLDNLWLQASSGRDIPFTINIPLSKKKLTRQVEFSQNWNPGGSVGEIRNGIWLVAVSNTPNTQTEPTLQIQWLVRWREQ